MVRVKWQYQIRGVTVCLYSPHLSQWCGAGLTSHVDGLQQMWHQLCSTQLSQLVQRQHSTSLQLETTTTQHHDTSHLSLLHTQHALHTATYIPQLCSLGSTFLYTWWSSSLFILQFPLDQLAYLKILTPVKLILTQLLKWSHLVKVKERAARDTQNVFSDVFWQMTK